MQLSSRTQHVQTSRCSAPSEGGVSALGCQNVTEHVQLGGIQWSDHVSTSLSATRPSCLWVLRKQLGRAPSGLGLSASWRTCKSSTATIKRTRISEGRLRWNGLDWWLPMVSEGSNLFAEGSEITTGRHRKEAEPEFMPGYKSWDSKTKSVETLAGTVIWLPPG